MAALQENMDMPQITHFIEQSNDSLLPNILKKSTGADRKNVPRIRNFG